VIDLRLVNVKSLTLLLGAAGFRPGQEGTLQVTTDGPVTVRLAGSSVHLVKGHETVHFALPCVPYCIPTS
jgi:hypothetical protein